MDGDGDGVGYCFGQGNKWWWMIVTDAGGWAGKLPWGW
jgi:hypothetical protein